MKLICVCRLRANYPQLTTRITPKCNPATYKGLYVSSPICTVMLHSSRINTYKATAVLLTAPRFITKVFQITSLLEMPSRRTKNSAWSYFPSRRVTHLCVQLVLSDFTLNMSTTGEDLFWLQKKFPFSIPHLRKSQFLVRMVEQSRMLKKVFRMLSVIIALPFLCKNQSDNSQSVLNRYLTSCGTPTLKHATYIWTKWLSLCFRSIFSCGS